VSQRKVNKDLKNTSSARVLSIPQTRERARKVRVPSLFLFLKRQPAKKAAASRRKHLITINYGPCRWDINNFRMFVKRRGNGYENAASSGDPQIQYRMSRIRRM